ncbi:threonine/homoserine/homoserine lactone efflux protein [Rhodoblastus acidophilus]|uniref:LysE family translocator n=1 Tax=Rhodoblastus acidophilus TaxID=1074 RepID=UPI002223F784|nr:hypothetical protein [Rhodoblastus acidophilus]MCW2283192.1 threonine/homoserine/homoserine lactone efflux protein [Rhodoblastus acidophilus]MCW2332052.1 threonine/homoserine/homoserine lactone efflux protein [Rhodoblastus acidophilus]
MLTFVTAAASLLATPGPTNTLLAASGASRGVRRSLPLLAAELAGYGLAIATLRLALGPLIAKSPALGAGLGLAVTLYLLHVAATLWRRGAAEDVCAGPITFARVFTTTLLNPKALILAFTVLPAPTDAALFSSAALLAALIPVLGGSWLAMGALVRQNGALAARGGVVYRFSALVLVGFAAMIGTHALGIA